MKPSWVSFLILCISVATAQIPREAQTNSDLDDILYFGWFINATTSASVQKYTNTVFRYLYNEVPAVVEFMENVNPKEDPFTYYVKPLDPVTSLVDLYYHVTAMYCGDTDCTDYYAKAKGSMGSTFETHLIGLFFTKDSFGVRVNLSEAQLPLFEVEASALASAKVELYKHTNRNKNYPGIQFVPQELNCRPSTSRAHMTLGCAPKVPAVQTGYDLLTIVNYEANPSPFEEVVIINLGVLRIFEKANVNKTAFVLYPTHKMVVNGVFEAYRSSTASHLTSALETILTLVTMLMIMCKN